MSFGSNSVKVALLAAALGACGGDDDELGAAMVALTTTTVPPQDGRCTHLVATRLADFSVTEYIGPLDGAMVSARTGTHRITATSYPEPCNAEPEAAPWLADVQLATFVAGANKVELSFRKNTSVDIDAVFIDDDPSPLIEVAGSRYRAGRNGEDMSGPNYVIDAWDVSQIALPPLAPSETFLFSTYGKGLTEAPRGMARLTDGSWLFQSWSATSPVLALDELGNQPRLLPIVYGAGTTPRDGGEGLEAVDSQTLVRTSWSDAGVPCPESPTGCYGGIEFLDRVVVDGSDALQVAHQINLPFPYQEEYPVGVTMIGSNIAVTILPGTGAELLILDQFGQLVAGPTPVPGSPEGLAADGTGRIIAMDYLGDVTTYDANGNFRGESSSYPLGANLRYPFALSWRSAGAGSALVVHDTNKLVEMADLASPPSRTIDLAVVAGGVGGIGYRADTDQLLVMERVPRQTPQGRVPAVHTFDLGTGLHVGSRTLAAPFTLPVRTRSVAFLPASGEIVTHYRRPVGLDVALESVAYVHDLATGAHLRSIDFGAFGFRSITSVEYDAARDELLFRAVDLLGGAWLVATTPAGVPLRSHALSSIPGVSEHTVLPSGELGVLTAEPGFFLRAVRP